MWEHGVDIRYCPCHHCVLMSQTSRLLDFCMDTMLNSPLPTMTTHLKCRPLFPSFAELWWLGIVGHGWAVGRKQWIEATHTDTWRTWPLLNSPRAGCIIFFFKDCLLLGGKTCPGDDCSQSKVKLQAQQGTDIFGLVEVTSSCVPVPGQLRAAFSFSILLNLRFL